MAYTDECRKTELRLLCEAYRDKSGILRWRANDLIPPPEVARLGGKIFLTPSEVAEQIYAWDAQNAAIWGEYDAVLAKRRSTLSQS
jgi:hypothetical protein